LLNDYSDFVKVSSGLPEKPAQNYGKIGKESNFFPSRVPFIITFL